MISIGYIFGYLLRKWRKYFLQFWKWKHPPFNFQFQNWISFHFDFSIPSLDQRLNLLLFHWNCLLLSKGIWHNSSYFTIVLAYLKGSYLLEVLLPLLRLRPCKIAHGSHKSKTWKKRNFPLIDNFLWPAKIFFREILFREILFRCTKTTKGICFSQLVLLFTSSPTYRYIRTYILLYLNWLYTSMVWLQLVVSHLQQRLSFTNINHVCSVQLEVKNSLYNINIRDWGKQKFRTG